MANMRTCSMQFTAKRNCSNGEQQEQRLWASNKTHSKTTSMMGVGSDGKVLNANFWEVANIMADHIGPYALL